MQRVLSVIAVVSLGCATTVPLDELAQVAEPDTRIDTGGLIAGGRIGLLPSRTCPVEVYAPGEAVSARAGSAADEVFPRKELTRLTVNALLVDADRATALVADVTDMRGRQHRLAIKTGEQVGCLVPWSEALERLHEVIGTVVAFRPEGGACNAIALRGDNVRKLFDTHAVERAFEVTAITVRGDRAVPWVRVGDMEVRHDVLASCFAPATSGSSPVLEASSGAAPNQSIERLVGAYPGTCHAGRDGGLECVSSVAVWQGRLRDGEIDLRRVRRTMGVMLMREGAISAAPSGERIVVGIPEVRNARIATVRQGLAAALSNLAARPIAGVAVADASQGTGDLRVDIELRDLVLGRLTTAKVAATSEYVARYEDKLNPAYDVANAAAIRARGERDAANAAYQAELKQFESNKKVCEMAGEQVKKMAGGGVLGSLVGAAGEAGCGMALSPSTDGIVQAETALATAEATLATTPRTVQSPVMAPWTYEKTTYHRSVAVKVVLKIHDAKSNTAETRTIAVEHVWDDYSAARDEAHNVEGHDVPAAMLADADGLLPALAAKVEASARAAVSQRIVELGLAPARAALAATFAATKDDQLVDSSAYLVARERLRGALAHGEARVGGDKSVTVQLGSFATQANGCVLVVALPSDLSKRVKISAKGNSIADQRGVVPAYIEACGSAAELGSVELASDGDTTVRWGAYATSIFETTIAASDASASP